MVSINEEITKIKETYDSVFTLLPLQNEVPTDISS